MGTFFPDDPDDKKPKKKKSKKITKKHMTKDVENDMTDSSIGDRTCGLCGRTYQESRVYFYFDDSNPKNTKLSNYDRLCRTLVSKTNDGDYKHLKTADGTPVTTVSSLEQFLREQGRWPPPRLRKHQTDLAKACDELMAPTQKLIQ